MRPYVYPGWKRLGAALVMAGFELDGKASEYGSEVRTMLGIAFKESSGDARKINVNEDVHKSRDFGVWQINDYWEGGMLCKVASLEVSGMARKARFHHFLRETDRQWSDHIDNAWMARQTYLNWKPKPDFRPWIVYRNGLTGVPWREIDQGIIDLRYEMGLGWRIERIASIFLEGLTRGEPLKR